MIPTRRDFLTSLGLTAVGSAIAAPLRAEVLDRLANGATGTSWDMSWVDKLATAKYRVVFDVSPAPTDAYGQTHRCLAIALAAMEQVGASAADVVRTRIMLTRAEDFPEIARAHGDVFRETRPVNTSYVVAALLDPRWLLEIELEAQIP